MSKLVSWMKASDEEVWQRLWMLECELSVAAALVENRERIAVQRGEPGSELIALLLQKWRSLINQEPTTKARGEQP